jgi:hypothetical protein
MVMTRARASLVAVLLAATLAGCAGGLGGLPGQELVRSEVLFGRARMDGSTVSDAQWVAFVDEHVTPRFPDGLTLIEARGQYRTRAGQLVREPSVLLVLIHDGSEKSRAAIEEIRTLYKRLFDQESVLLLSAPVRASF